MFALTAIGCPSSVIAGRWLTLVILDLYFSCRRCFSWYSMITSSSGLIITSPLFPSTIKRSPSPTNLVADSRPTTTGIWRACAIIAACEVLPPASVIKPMTLLGFNSLVSPADNSWATIITRSLMWDRLCCSSPERFLRILSTTFSTSFTRLLIYSSSTWLNAHLISSSDCFSAHSALIFSFDILWIVASWSMLSFKIIKWLSKIKECPFSCSGMPFLMALSWSSVVRAASSNLSTSLFSWSSPMRYW